MTAPTEPSLPEWLAQELSQVRRHGDGDAARIAIEALCERHPQHAPALLASAGRLPSTEPGRGGSLPGEALSPTPLPERVGPYRILAVLGEGGMGVVYLAEQEQPIRRRVAVKVIKLGMDSRSVLLRFEGERQALALMEHENIAKVLEVGLADDGRPWFAMEYVQGLPITEYCDAHALALPERLELFRQVCAGVQHAHHKGIIHRDLKPANILVAHHEGRAVPKIIDFGLARAMEHRLVTATLCTEQGQILGTPEYMSPEQADMGNHDIDTRTDVYSLGVVLYELLVGELPFSRERIRQGGLLEIQRMIREVDPPRPSFRLAGQQRASAAAIATTAPDRAAWQQSLRNDVDWIVLRALEKDPSRRYQTALAFADDLNRHLRNEPVAARPPTLSYRVTKFVRKHRVPVAAAALVMATIVAGVAVSVHMLFAARTARDEARQLAATSQLQLAHMQMVAIDQASFWTARTFDRARAPSLADVLGKQVDGAPVLSGLSNPPLDPWGRPYRLEPRGSPGDWIVRSDGPNGRAGDADDLEVHDRMFTVDTQRHLAELFAQRAGRLLELTQELNVLGPGKSGAVPLDPADAVDPWGNLMIPQQLGDQIVVRSSGPDGKSLTDDDLMQSRDLMPVAVDPADVRNQIGRHPRILCLVHLRHISAERLAASLVAVRANLGSVVRGLTINPVDEAAVALLGAPEQVAILLEYVKEIDRSE